MKAALLADDATYLTLLVRYPLSVSGNAGTILIANPATLFERAEEVFPPDLRIAVLEPDPEGPLCTSGGIGYGHGQLWVDTMWEGTDEDHPEHFRIGHVNLRGEPSGSAGPVFVCRTSIHRSVIDRSEDGDLRYRSWELESPLTSAPDIVLRSGREEFQGSGVCAYKSFVFEYDETVYRVGEVGCSSISDAPPDGARGRLSITVNGETTTSSYCY